MKTTLPLLEQLDQTSSTVLWLADENATETLASLVQHAKRLYLVSNRFDVAQAATELGIHTRFSDFDLQFTHDLPTQQQPRDVFYRVSKERPVVNHIVNSVFSLLPEGGKLWLAGQKNEGIKTYFSQAARLFGSNNKLRKNGDVYWGHVEKRVSDGALLNDRDYTQLRWIQVAGENMFISKPGTYGWDKIDKGSEFLVAQIAQHIDNLGRSCMDFLDLGCGYGYLTLQCRKFGFASMTATDNNAAAIACMQANAEHFGIPVTIVADDCGASLTGSFDFIVCNPPFHQGFSVDSSLTDKFLNNTQRLLAQGGRAYFVVNAFIPLESKAIHFFPPGSNRISVIANNGQFKVIGIQKV